MVILPAQPVRAEYTGFGLALASMGFLLALLVHLLWGPAPAWLVAMLSLGVAAVAAVHPTAFAASYRLWNRAARKYARLMRPLVLRVGHGVLLRTVARAGTSMRVARPAPGESFWTPRASAVDVPTVAAPAGARGAGWLASYLRWAWRARRPEAVALLPLVLILRGLQEPAELDEPHEVAENVYTLF